MAFLSVRHHHHHHVHSRSPHLPKGSRNLLDSILQVPSTKSRSSSPASSSSPLTTTCYASSSSSSSRRRRQNHPKRKLENGILGVEKSLIVDRGISFVLGSDESGTGCIAGPVVVATCCILPLSASRGGQQQQRTRTTGPSGPSSSPTYNPFEQYDPIKLVVSDGIKIKDSKQLTPQEREAIYEEIVDNPHIYDFTVAQRSNQQIDATNNILTSTMECYQQSIQELADDFLLCTGNNKEGDEYEYDEYDDDSTTSCSCYSIVDGQKAPKVRLAGGGVLPCRPFVKGDSQVLTVALASVIAKVTRDRMVPSWHEQYPQYGFNVHKGYATREHIEAIHRYGPCPLHRMTFKSLKGR